MQHFKLRLITTLTVSLIIILISVNTSFSQEQVIATTTNYLNMRQGPSTEYGIITRLELNESLIIIGRNSDGSWLNATTMNSAYTGWVATSYLSLSTDLRISDLPIQPITQATTNITPATSSSEVQS